MPISVVMPALEMAQETGKLVAWRKKEGEAVAKGEVLLEIETDKAVMEIESPGAGTLAGVKVGEGAVVPVGQTIAWIVGPGEVPPAEPEASPSLARAFSETASRPPGAARPQAQQESAGAKASPKARRLAKELGVDLSTLRGSGPGGEILAADIQAAAEKSASPVSPPPEKLGPVARLMAERTTQSWTTVPHFFLVREVDATALNQARAEAIKALEKDGIKPTLTDFLIALVARALVKHPRMNASWSGNSIRLNPEVNVGVAIAVDDGVVTAVIHDTDKANLRTIATQRQELAARAKQGKLRPADISGATFTISNLGMFQVDAFSAIITPPQAAILAVGSVTDRVVAVEGKPAVRPMMTLTLSTDHRVADGARAAAFLNDFAESILKLPRPLLWFT